jgi:hypothetical protein
MVSSVLLNPPPRESIVVHSLPSKGGNPIKGSPSLDMDCQWHVEWMEQEQCPGSQMRPIDS